MDLQPKIEEAAKKFQEVVETLGKNYAGAVIANAFTPVLEDGIASFLSDVKSAAGKAEDDGDIKGLAEDPEEKSKDAILVAVDALKPVHNTRYNLKFMAYSTFTIRIGSTGDDKAKKFYVNAHRYDIRYTQLSKVPDKVKADFKDAKLPAFPAPHEFGGTYCICLTKAEGDRNAHLKAIQEYFPAMTKALPGYSDTLASFFKIGNNWEVQQTAYQVFTDAFNNTMSDLGLTSVQRDLPPFDEVEALVILLQGVADKDILPGIFSSITAEGALGERLKDTARGSILGVIDKAAQGWAPLSEAAGKAGAKVVEKVKEGAEKLLDLLKPALEKIIALIQEKMAEKGDSKEEESSDSDEKGGAEVGQVAARWQFQLTAIGKQLHESLAAKKASEAISESTDNIKKALTEGVRGPLSKAASFVTGSGNNAVKKIVSREVNKLTTKIVNLITELTTLDGFLAAGKVLGEVVDKIEGKLGEADVADKASQALWEGLSSQAMELFQRIYNLSEKVSSEMSGFPEEAVSTVTGLLDHIFEVQVRAFNSIRIQYVRNLRASLADGKDDKVAASRAALRTAVFSTIDLLGAHHFVKAYEALNAASKIIVLDWVQQNVWPPVKSGLEAIQSLIPSEISDLGLKLEPMAWKLLSILISKALDWVLKKVFLAIEKAIFTQSEGGY
jgi:hypothetical protein